MNTHKTPSTARFDPSGFALENFLPYRLSLLTNTISHGLAESYRTLFDITVTEWRVLAVLGRFPGLPAREVVKRTAMDKVAISRAVKTLEQKGLLKRRTDPEDRRRQRLFLEKNSGEEVLSTVLPLARRYESDLLQALTTEERRQLDSIMRKLQAAADALHGEQE